MNKSINRKTIKHNDYIELELTGGEYVKIDYDTYDKIKDSCWYKSKRNSIESRINKKLVKLHRFIMNAPNGMLVDHKNGDILDNRKENLRICSLSENNRNKCASRISKTGIKGIRLKKGKYNVQITLNGKRYWGGVHIFIEDAINAVNMLTTKLHGEYAKIQEVRRVIG